MMKRLAAIILILVVAFSCVACDYDDSEEKAAEEVGYEEGYDKGHKEGYEEGFQDALLKVEEDIKKPGSYTVRFSDDTYDIISDYFKENINDSGVLFDLIIERIDIDYYPNLSPSKD